VFPGRFYTTIRSRSGQPNQNRKFLFECPLWSNLLSDLKSIIAKGQYKAYKAVDNIRVQTYWQLGERIVREELKQKDRANSGKYLIDNVALNLGIKRPRLYEIVKFYRVYPIVRALHGQLSWYHYLYLISIEDEHERGFYQNQSVLHSWSYRELRKQIRARLYENTPKKEIQTVFQTKLPAVRPQEEFKDTYDFQFIELHSGQNEKDLENKILNNFKKFLHELGEDFSILGRQVLFKIDGETHTNDMVL